MKTSKKNRLFPQNGKLFDEKGKEVCDIYELASGTDGKPMSFRFYCIDGHWPIEGNTYFLKDQGTETVIYVTENKYDDYTQADVATAVCLFTILK